MYDYQYAGSAGHSEVDTVDVDAPAPAPALKPPVQTIINNEVDATAEYEVKGTLHLSKNLVFT